MRGNSKTEPSSRDERAQTTQDFVIGIGIFLLAVAFVFSFLPSLLSPYAPAVDGGDAAQANRVAGEVLETTGGNGTNEIKASTFETQFDKNSGDLVSDLGLRSSSDAIDRVNVSIERLNQSEEVSDRTVVGGGDVYGGDPGASSARIVRVDWDEEKHGDLSTLKDDEEIDDVCDPACRLVVRVW